MDEQQKDEEVKQPEGNPSGQQQINIEIQVPPDTPDLRLRKLLKLMLQDNMVPAYYQSRIRNWAQGCNFPL